ncbi:hypothetical protein BX600DRAFT_445505 [Xylariales sp. PMI_506]|nr:hypothetical protein BX600DRAFT_445505 [Xylariales sp. PMI_506]
MSDHHGEPATGLEVHVFSRRDSELQLIATPVVSHEKTARAAEMELSHHGKEPDVENLGIQYSEDPECPEFVKHSATTNYELFYDLWFVASLEVFASTKQISQKDDLYSYVGYLSIIWFTWFLVGIFDVRFVTDSIYERVIRTAHLGVMLGFSVVVTYFDPENQDKTVFQTLSIILMVSRLVLVVQYGTIIWHIRHFTKGRRAVAAAAGVHFIAAMIFLGITFRFRDNKNSRVYVVWYIVAACEAILQLVLAYFFKVLTFSRTHLTERMTVLTVIILGEGVTNIAQNVAVIVKNSAAWTSATIGVLTSAIATFYFFFMIYFDWMSNHHHLSGWRQLTWAFLHFPFHVALLLFTEGGAQFIIWWKGHETEVFTANQFYNVITVLGQEDQPVTTQLVLDSLNNTMSSIFEVYPITYIQTAETIDNIMTNISNFPDEAWYKENSTYETQFIYDITELLYTVINSVFVDFEVDPFEDMDFTSGSLDDLQNQALEEINVRYHTVFQYTYVTAGLVLMLLVTLYALSKRHGWTPFVILRTVFFFLLGLGLALVELINRNVEYSLNYLGTPWLMPTICIVFFVVLVLWHLPHPPPLFSPGQKRGRGGSSWASRWPYRRRGGRSNRSTASSHGGSVTVYSGVHVDEDGGAEVPAERPRSQIYDPHTWQGAENAYYTNYGEGLGYDLGAAYPNGYGQAEHYDLGSMPTQPQQH